MSRHDPISDDTVWAAVRSIPIGTTISNWTVLKGDYGEPFAIRAHRTGAVVVDAPGAESLQSVPRRDFEVVARLWPQYIARTLPRKQLTPETRFSKYIISILHHLQTPGVDGVDD